MKDSEFFDSINKMFIERFINKDVREVTFGVEAGGWVAEITTHEFSRGVNTQTVVTHRGPLCHR